MGQAERGGEQIIEAKKAKQKAKEEAKQNIKNELIANEKLILQALQSGTAQSDGLICEFDGGVGDILLIYDNRVTIRRKGVSNFVIMGLKGDKTIYIADMTSVQIKQGGFTAGYLQFSLPGGNESRGGVIDAMGDENTIAFGADKNEIAQEIVKYINKILRKIKSPQTVAPTVVNQVSICGKILT